MFYYLLQLLAETIGDGMSLFFGIYFRVVIDIDVEHAFDDCTINHVRRAFCSLFVGSNASVHVIGNLESAHSVFALHVAQIIEA